MQYRQSGAYPSLTAGSRSSEREGRFAKALVDEAVRRFGGLDIVINDAGAAEELGPVTELSVDGWRAL